MKITGLEGNVLVDFLVDTQGNVRQAYAIRSNNPAFEPGALAAVRRWHFQPGLKDGNPVVCHMQVPIVFEIPGNRGSDLFSITASGKKLPAEFRVDTPPKVKGVVLPVYPVSLLAQHISGEGTVVAFIDQRGRVIHAMVTHASRPEFGYALQAAISACEFEPAMRDGKPAATLIRREEKFNWEMLTDHLDPNAIGSDQSLLRTLQRHPERFASARELSAPIRPLGRRAPTFPPDVAAVTSTGEALIEFVIDYDGHARVPRIVSATRPEFGYAAVQAVAYWDFEPPLQGKKHVMTKVQIPIRFSVREDSNPKTG